MAHNHTHDHNDITNIKLAFFLNITFTILEIFGGFWTNSMAILSDALHDLGDSFSLGLSWFLQNYSKKEVDQKFSFGYSRFSLLGALINSIILIIGSVLILTRAIPRILHPENTHPQGMLLFAIVGIIINGAAVLRLKKGSSLNERVVSWHLLEDVLGWVAILIVSLILMFKDWPILDPLLSIVITGYVVYNVYGNLKRIMNIFLQGVPAGISIPEIQQAIMEETEAISVHHTHIWSLEGENAIYYQPILLLIMKSLVRN